MNIFGNYEKVNGQVKRVFIFYICAIRAENIVWLNLNIFDILYNYLKYSGFNLYFIFAVIYIVALYSLYLIFISLKLLRFDFSYPIKLNNEIILIYIALKTNS